MYLHLRAIDFWRSAGNYQGPQEVTSEAKSESDHNFVHHSFVDQQP
jgi:hypothetical protein